MTKVRYVRMYADPDGESHFADEEADLRPVDFAPPAPPLNLSAPISAKQVAFFEMPEGWYGDWHPAPQRQFFFFLAGEIEARVSDGEVRRFRPGSVLLTGAWHNRFRKLLVRFSKRMENYRGLVHFACALIIYRLTAL